MCNLRKYHNLEYNLNKRAFWSIFVLSFLSLSITNLRIYVYKYHEESLEQDMCGRHKFHSIHSWHRILDIIYDNFVFNMQFHNLVLAFAFIKWKNTFDMLQGISKLDNIIRVSMF